MSISKTTPTTGTPWLDAKQQKAWRSFLGGSTVLNEQLDRDLRARFGLSISEYEILVRLSESEQRRVRMAELASALSHSRSRITHTIARLEKLGLVERLTCADDGRGVSAGLTDEGFATLERAAHVHVAGVHDYLVSKTTAQEFRIIGEVFERVRTDLEGKRF